MESYGALWGRLIMCGQLPSQRIGVEGEDLDLLDISLGVRQLLTRRLGDIPSGKGGIGGCVGRL